MCLRGSFGRVSTQVIDDALLFGSSSFYLRHLTCTPCFDGFVREIFAESMWFGNGFEGRRRVDHAIALKRERIVYVLQTSCG